MTITKPDVKPDRHSTEPVHDTASPVAATTTTEDTTGTPAATGQPAATLRLDDQLCFALYGAANAVIRAYRPLLRDLGLTYPQYLLMMALWEHDNVTTADLARRLDLPPHGLGPVLDRLHHQGLLDKHPATTDRRSVQIRLTPTGRHLEHHAARVQHEVVCRSQLDPDSLNQIRTTLHTLTDHLNTATSSDADSIGDTPAVTAG